MKKLFLAAVAALAVALVILAIMGREMKEIKTEIEIAATPEKVWDIIKDIEKWQEWNPVINKSAGQALEGAKLNITMCGKEEGQDGPNYSPVITKIEEAKRLTWRATMMAGFIFTNGKIIELTETDNGTHVVHKETFSGLMAAMMGKHMDEGVPPILNRFNKALKETAEN